jgi:hypothetical protein
VTGGRIVAVAREKRDGNGEFGASIEGEPVHGTNKALIGLDERLFGFNRSEIVDNAVDNKARAVGAGNGVTISKVIFVKKSFDLSGLSDGDRETAVGGSLPDVARAKEPGDVTHKIDFKVLLDSLFEHAFNVVGSGEVGKVVNVDAKK